MYRIVFFVQIFPYFRKMGLTCFVGRQHNGQTDANGPLRCQNQTAFVVGRMNSAATSPEPASLHRITRAPDIPRGRVYLALSKFKFELSEGTQ